MHRAVRNWKNRREGGFEVKLSQEETLGFKSTGIDAEVQIRARWEDGTAVASNVIVVPVSKIIKGGVI